MKKMLLCGIAAVGLFANAQAQESGRILSQVETTTQETVYVLVDDESGAVLETFPTVAALAIGQHVGYTAVFDGANENANENATTGKKRPGAPKGQIRSPKVRAMVDIMH